MGTASKKANKTAAASSRDVQKFKDICEIAGIDFEATVGKFTSSELRKIETGKAVGHIRRREEFNESEKNERG